MAKLEKRIESAVVNYARENGIRVLKVNTLYSRGWPDRIFWVPGGRPLVIEFKAPGEVPTELQADCIEYLKENRYEVYVVDSKIEGIALIDAALEAARVHAKGRKVAARTRGSGAVSRSRPR